MNLCNNALRQRKKQRKQRQRTQRYKYINIYLYTYLFEMHSTNVYTNNEFLTETNAQMIWDIMQESSVYNDVEYQDKIEIRKHFVQNMRAFYEQKGKGIPHLIEQNKLFISAALNEYRTKEKPFKKEAYTIKDIQAERASQFERDLDKRRNDFENSIATPKPRVPVFSDEMDKPISEMSALVARAMAEREKEITQIHQVLAKPLETSIKQEKQLFKQIYISNEEAPRNIIQETILSPTATTATTTTNTNSMDKKVTVDESRNRVHLFVEEEDNEDGFMSKFKRSSLPVVGAGLGVGEGAGLGSDPWAAKKSDDNVYQELRQVQRKQQQQYQELLLKMDDLTKKVDMIIDLIRSPSLTP